MSKPTALNFVKYTEPTPEQKFAALGPIAERHGRFAKGAVLSDTITEACPRVKVSDLNGHIPSKYYEKNLEQNQQAPSCCRHPENHEIAAFKSHPNEKAPDIYIFYCECGRKHRYFICSRTDDVPRPIWSAA